MTIDGKEYSNEELSRATEMLEKLDKSGYEYTALGREKYLIDNFIPKDKIREKLKEKQERAKKYYEKRGIFHNCNLCNNTCNWYKFCITYKELLEEK